MKLLFGFMLVIFAQFVYAQQPDSLLFSVDVKFQSSTIWTNRTMLQQFTQNHPQTFQVDLGVLKNTREAWNYCNCFSKNGLTLSYTDFRSQNLGHAFVVAGFTEPTIFNTKRFRFSVRGSVGLAFVNKLYDSITNKDNIFFSTHTSFFLGLGANAYVRLNNKIKAVATFQFNHISNGGRRDPNEGMNFPGISVGLSYDFNPMPLKKRQVEKFTEKNWSLVLHGFGTQRTAVATTTLPEEMRAVIGLNAGVIKRIGRMNGIGAGGEFYNDGINSVLQQRSNQRIQTQTAGVNIQHYLFLGRLLFGQQAAWFVTPNTGYQRIFYQRYFLEYELKKNWFAGFTLKAHADHSDYLAFTTGYFFKL